MNPKVVIYTNASGKTGKYAYIVENTNKVRTFEKKELRIMKVDT